SPNLRERVEDIPLLALAFMQSFAKENGTKPKPIDEAVITALVNRRWPGNVRELKNVVERMAILSGDRVTIADLPEDPHESPFFGDDDAGGGGGGAQDSGSAPASEAFDEAGSSAAEDGGGGAHAAGGLGSVAKGGNVPVAGQYLTLREFREQTERKYIVDTLK